MKIPKLHPLQWLIVLAVLNFAFVLIVFRPADFTLHTALWMTPFIVCCVAYFLVFIVLGIYKNLRK